MHSVHDINISYMVRSKEESMGWKGQGILSGEAKPSHIAMLYSSPALHDRCLPHNIIINSMHALRMTVQ